MITIRDLIAPLARLPGAASILLCLGVALTYFVDQPSWNQNSRYALTRAIVEHQSFNIDPYHASTGDKSFRAGHFYCDKAPGVSWLGVPGYAVYIGLRQLAQKPLPKISVRPLDPLDRALGRAPTLEQLKAGDVLTYDRAYRFGLQICRWTGLLPITLAGLASFYLLLLRWGARPLEARWVTLASLFCTPMFPYATALYGHQVSGALLMIAATAILVPARRCASSTLAVLAGAALGLSVCVEYTAAVPTAIFTIFAWNRHGFRFFAALAASGLPFAAALAGYHTIAFGRPLATGYDFVYLDEFAEGMRVQYGIRAPDLAVALQLLWGRYRGLFALSPVLLLAPFGLWIGLRSSDEVRKSAAILSVIVFLYYLSLNAGYYMWDGGAAFGPRHLIPSLPFLALGLYPARRALLRATTWLAGLSAFQMFVAAMARPEAPSHGDPIWEYSWTRLWSASERVYGDDLGQILGIPAPFSVLPLLVAWWIFWPRASGEMNA